MNRIAIIGHAASGYEEVDVMLRQCGMREAQPSRRDGLLPQEISAILCKAHKLPPLETVTSEDDIIQIQAGPVWHGMALDLLLGNLDQELWGWADPKALYTLDYWMQLDDKLTLVLVYDKPHRVLTKDSLANREGQPIEALQHQLNHWVAYNGALLRFYLRNSDRCLLVHSQQVQLAADRYLQQLQPLLDTPLAHDTVLALDELTSEGDLSDSGNATLRTIPTLSQELILAANTAGIESHAAASLMEIGATEAFLVDAVLANHPAALQMYAELQSAANLPLDETLHTNSNSDASFAWQSQLHRRSQVSGLIIRLHDAYQRTNDELKQTRAQHAEFSLQMAQQAAEANTAHAKVVEQLTRQIAEAKAALNAEKGATAKSLASIRTQLESERAKSVSEENRLLLSQLHQVQEELERYYLDNQRLKQQLPAPLYGAAEHIRQQLDYRLGAVMIQRSRSLSGWLGMPWALRDEAKSFYEDQAKRPAENRPPLHTYCDVDEAERMKRHLSYRLGSTMLTHNKTLVGWFKLPFALRREIKQFQRQHKVA
ncbi:TPA: hypothetical protein SIA33_001437 [Aeromonas salmonicida]|nr:hypothetical protein [Aeromonas salmonicida]